ncbi:MAG: ABC transporter substrate-binding protein [Patescibacteria group bacterium]
MQNDQHPIDDFFGLKQDSSPEIKKEPLKHIFRRSSFFDQIRLLPKVLSKKERYWILTFILVIAGSILSIPFSTYSHFTNPSPDFGGLFSEGVLGQPRRVNPLLSQSNDADRDLATLVYSGLLRHNEEGKLVPDLAKSYEISSDGLNYTIYLRDNVLWHDGQKLTTDDIVYTIETAQNVDYGSSQRVSWQGVTIQKVNDTTIIFKLNNKYAQFLNNLTLGIIPKHVWEKVQPINFSSSEYNLKPIGSGPYMFEKLQKDSTGQIQSYQLKSNENYYAGKPYIDTVIMKFYDSEGTMIDAYNRNDIQELSMVSPQNLSKIKFKQRLNIKEIKMPRYYGVFFNQTTSAVLADKNIRLAINYATNKKAIVDEVISGKGTIIYSPLIETVLDVNQDIPKYQFDIDQAKKVLLASGWTGTDNKGILKKKDSRLTVKITTSTLPEFSQVANILKEQWGKAGIEVTIEALNTPQLQQAIRDRNYEALLFGEILDLDPDPFTLWDSSQKQKLGLNLALYDNATADNLLQDARQSLNPLDRAKKYDDFQKIVINDVPAVFLYNPLYLYPQSTNIRGANTSIIAAPSDRLLNIENWYIDTKRIWK